MIKTTAAAAPCPEWVKDPEARRLWWEIASHVRDLVGLTPANAERLARYCTAYLEMMRTSHLISEHGLVRETRKGPKAQPYVRQHFKASRTMLYHAIALGLTPMSRERILAKRRTAQGGGRR